MGSLLLKKVIIVGVASVNGLALIQGLCDGPDKVDCGKVRSLTVVTSVQKQYFVLETLCVCNSSSDPT